MQPPFDSNHNDFLNQQIGVLARREAEARILAPILESLHEAFGKDEVIRIVSRTIVAIARQQGADLARNMGGNSSSHFKASLQYWCQGDALEIEFHHHDETHLDFDVKRCRYAEMYRDLGISELGQILSCNRDFALIRGFNPRTELSRSQTIMAGAPHCDFRYRFPAL